MKIEINNDNDIEKIISKNLHEFNKKHCEYIKLNSIGEETKSEKCNFIISDNNEIIGGSIGILKYNWYFLDELWINEKYRGKNIGTSLILKIEEYAKEQKLTGIRMETWNFQARGFYEKMGYKVWGEVKDCPPGTICYFLEKEIDYVNN